MMPPAHEMVLLHPESSASGCPDLGNSALRFSSQEILGLPGADTQELIRPGQVY